MHTLLGSWALQKDALPLQSVELSGLSLKMVLLIALTSVKMVRDLQAKSTLFI